jgi:phage gp36-like protein
MSTPTLASLSQLEARFPGGLHDDDTNRALAALEDASAWIRVEAGEDWLDESGGLETVPAAIVSICCAVARRIVDNPAGIMQRSIAGYSEGLTNATTDVYLTKQEKTMIHKITGTGLTIVTLESPYTPPLPNDIALGNEYGYDGYEDWYTPQ